MFKEAKIILIFFNAKQKIITNEQIIKILQTWTFIAWEGKNIQNKNYLEVNP